MAQLSTEGAAQGAAVGSVAGPWGTLVGAVFGAFGAFSGDRKQRKAQERAELTARTSVLTTIRSTLDNLKAQLAEADKALQEARFTDKKPVTVETTAPLQFRRAYLFIGLGLGAFFLMRFLK